MPTLDTASIDEQLRHLKTLEAIELSRRRFLPFVQYTMPDHEHPKDPTRSRYKAALHHQGIARVIEQVVEGDIRFLILCCPPRHGKSELVSRRLPAYFLGLHPEQEVIVATYNDDFAEDFGSDVREIMRTQQYRNVFPDTVLSKSGRAKDHLQTTKGGAAYFVGRGGSLTGRGGHILICDDLIKDAKEAASQAIRNQAWDWFTKVALSRRRGLKLVILTFTRWHADDPIGRLIDPENPYYDERLARKIKIINLPAIAEDDDPLGRSEGEPLWPDGPDKFDLEYLEEMRIIDPLGFEALYQQRPSLADGILFNRDDIRYYDDGDLPPLEELRFYCTSDHAVSTDQRRDFTVLLKTAVDTRDNIYLLECWWRRQRTDTVVEAMLEMARPGPTAPLIWWAERGQISKSIGPFLKKRMLEEGIFFKLVEETPVGDKEQRAQSISARVAMGKVFFPKNASWTERAINEMMAFPNGNHDDFVDTLSLVGLGLRSHVGGVLRPTDNSNKPGTIAWMREETARVERDARRNSGRMFLNG